MEVALLRIDTVYHVGRLEGRPPRWHHPSHEGECLSVSRCPQAWREIARLGEEPVFELHRPGGLFLDVYGMRENTALSDTLIEWGQRCLSHARPDKGCPRAGTFHIGAAMRCQLFVNDVAQSLRDELAHAVIDLLEIARELTQLMWT